MTKPVVMEQVGFAGFGEPPANDNGFIVAMGRRLHVEQFALLTGIDAQTIRSRLRSGWTPDEAVTRPFTPTNKRLSDAFTVPWGAAGSFTWDHAPYTDDPWCQDFVVKHRGGATVEVCCAAYGLEDSQWRATEQQALMKLRGLILDGDEAARSWFVDAFDEDALTALLERYGDTAPDSGSDDELGDDDAGPLFGREAA